MSPTSVFFEPHRPPSGPSTHPLMPSRQQQTVAMRGDDRLARARALRNPPTGAKRAGKERSWPHHLARCSYLSSLRAWSRHQEFFLGPSDPSISVALHSGGHMKPPGAPEVPIDARKRKGLIGTEVRGEKMRGPGARCV